jgi:hypothetical protein
MRDQTKIFVGVIVSVAFFFMLCTSDLVSVAEPSTVSDTVYVYDGGIQDSTELGVCALCTSTDMRFFVCTYAVCESTAYELSMGICEWNELDHIPSTWEQP